MSNIEESDDLEQEDSPKKRQRWDQETIIAKGRQLFTEKGFDLSMRDLARELNTQASSLYRHVQSKRELWFALTTKDYEDFASGLNNLVLENKSDPAIKLLRRVGVYFLEFARSDFNRFKLMFLYEPPKEQKTGPFEQECKPDSLTGLIEICDMVIQQEKLTKINAKQLAILVYSRMLGYAIITSPINDYLLQQKGFQYLANKTFDNYILDTLLEEINIHK